MRHIFDLTISNGGMGLMWCGNIHLELVNWTSAWLYMSNLVLLMAFTYQSSMWTFAYQSHHEDNIKISPMLALLARTKLIVLLVHEQCVIGGLLSSIFIIWVCLLHCVSYRTRWRCALEFCHPWGVYNLLFEIFLTYFVEWSEMWKDLGSVTDMDVHAWRLWFLG